MLVEEVKVEVLKLGEEEINEREDTMSERGRAVYRGEIEKERRYEIGSY